MQSRPTLESKPESEHKSESRIDREGWNSRYRAGQHTRPEPDPLLFHLYEEFIGPMFPRGGRGLDLAGGAGRHAIWMAKQGWRMALADLSDEATDIAARHAAESGVPLEILNEPAAETLAHAASTENQYDLIMVVQYLDRSLFPGLRKALRPGGLAFYKAHTLDHLALSESSPRDPDFMLDRQELLGQFAGLRVLHFNETVARRGTQSILVQMPPGSDPEGA